MIFAPTQIRLENGVIFIYRYFKTTFSYVSEINNNFTHNVSFRTTSFIALNIIQLKADTYSVPPTKVIFPSTTLLAFFAGAIITSISFPAENSASSTIFRLPLIILSRKILSEVFVNSDFFRPENLIFCFFNVICYYFINMLLLISTICFMFFFN